MRLQPDYVDIQFIKNIVVTLLLTQPHSPGNWKDARDGKKEKYIGKK